MKIPFKRGNILLPKNTDMTKWSVVACDQYTSEPEYWSDVEKIVGDNPSTRKLTLPEIYLEEENVQERINNINENMKILMDGDFFKEYKDSMIYLRRTQKDGKVREGLWESLTLKVTIMKLAAKPQSEQLKKQLLKEFHHVLKSEKMQH